MTRSSYLLTAATAATSMLLSACATQAPLTAEQLARFQPPECTTKIACDAMWQRAQGWIAQNSNWRIQTATDAVIQTYGPGDTPKAAFTVIREPMKEGSARIVMKAVCGNMFGCIPEPRDEIIRFNEHLRKTY